MHRGSLSSAQQQEEHGRCFSKAGGTRRRLQMRLVSHSQSETLISPVLAGFYFARMC